MHNYSIIECCSAARQPGPPGARLSLIFAIPDHIVISIGDFRCGGTQGPSAADRFIRFRTQMLKLVNPHPVPLGAGAHGFEGRSKQRPYSGAGILPVISLSLWERAGVRAAGFFV
jgi:hypothetical protein